MTWYVRFFPPHALGEVSRVVSDLFHHHHGTVNNSSAGSSLLAGQCSGLIRVLVSLASDYYGTCKWHLQLTRVSDAMFGDHS